MKKKLAAGVLSVVLLVGGATAALGTTDPDKLAEIKALTAKMFDLQKEIVGKEVDAALLTQEQADKMNKFIDQRQQSSTKALDEGKVFGPSLRKGMDKGMLNKGMPGGKEFNNGQPLTTEQIETWSKNANARLAAQVEAMTKNNKLTSEQIEAWKVAAETQLKIQADAMANGTFVPGDMGMGKVMSDNHRGAFGGKMASDAPATTDTNTQ
jgi:hypothetical protein